jgi:hypothetical protein
MSGLTFVYSYEYIIHYFVDMIKNGPNPLGFVWNSQENKWEMMSGFIADIMFILMIPFGGKHLYYILKGRTTIEDYAYFAGFQARKDPSQS